MSAEPTDGLVDRLHVTMREPATTYNGVHSYTRVLTAGQRALGLRTAVADDVDKRGTSPAWTPGQRRLAPGAVVHLHFSHAARPWLRNRDNRADVAAADARVVVHFHGPWADESAMHGQSALSVRLKRLYERDTYRRARRFVAASEAFADVLASRYGVDPARVCVVAPGVDTDRFGLASVDGRAEARAHLGLGDLVGPVFLTVRRLEHRMGVDVAVRALATLADASLVVVGDGSVAPDLRALVADLGLGDRVRFLGELSESDLPSAYAAADVVVVPSRGLEGFGITVLEAMAAGRPVVATRVGGLATALGPFADEALVDPEDPAGLAAALQRVARGPRPGGDYRDYALTRGPEATARLVEEALAELG